MRKRGCPRRAVLREMRHARLGGRPFRFHADHPDRRRSVRGRVRSAADAAERGDAPERGRPCPADPACRVAPPQAPHRRHRRHRAWRGGRCGRGHRRRLHAVCGAKRAGAGRERRREGVLPGGRRRLLHRHQRLCGKRFVVQPARIQRQASTHLRGPRVRQNLP